jgi:hypothetical protein
MSQSQLSNNKDQLIQTGPFLSHLFIYEDVNTATFINVMFEEKQDNR